ARTATKWGAELANQLAIRLGAGGTQRVRRVSAQQPVWLPLTEREPSWPGDRCRRRTPREAIGHARMPCAVGHAIGCAVAAEVELGRADGTDRPAAIAR